MFNQDVYNVLHLLIQEYSIKTVIQTLAAAASDEADKMVDMQISEKAHEFSYAAEELNNLADNLGQG